MSSDRIPLTRDRIVESALGLARHEGLAGVSMRKLAQELGVEAMSLYHHVPNKRALLILMADRSLASLRPADPALPWNQRLVTLLDDIFRAGVENPAMISVLAAQELDPLQIEASEISALMLIESVLQILSESGLEVAKRVYVYNSLINLVYGFVLARTQGATLAAPKGSGQDPARRLTGRWESFPALADVLDGLEDSDPAADLHFSLEIYVGALAGLVAAQVG
ncbi:TetR/AcrR family transcriptional regulator [Nakamurella sp. PAMC28650]|uniref:TetR/AcrR family transcriptional regulator n=1 Tax=Nakamurella sp. PAMC28650 TaxID=2762325 RepID=UPI00164D042B|nr:TetR family transcriptional regulator [Nakamurella sp. PAMC28650]QNK82318.1 TetR/AcrR family transcriptional regulator C-terminal domain-containing protein [Nakamurella sp. PAMC28650]